jgi:hypothetical protein
VQNSFLIRLRQAARSLGRRGLLLQYVAAALGLSLSLIPAYLIRNISQASWKLNLWEVCWNHPGIIFSLATFLLGTLAFWYKKKQLLYYGLTEIAFGVSSGFQIAHGFRLTEVMLV